MENLSIEKHGYGSEKLLSHKSKPLFETMEKKLLDVGVKIKKKLELSAISGIQTAARFLSVFGKQSPGKMFLSATKNNRIISPVRFLIPWQKSVFSRTCSHYNEVKLNGSCPISRSTNRKTHQEK